MSEFTFKDYNIFTVGSLRDGSAFCSHPMTRIIELSVANTAIEALETELDTVQKENERLKRSLEGVAYWSCMECETIIAAAYLISGQSWCCGVPATHYCEHCKSDSMFIPTRELEHNKQVKSNLEFFQNIEVIKTEFKVKAILELVNGAGKWCSMEHVPDVYHLGEEDFDRYMLETYEWKDVGKEDA